MLDYLEQLSTYDDTMEISVPKKLLCIIEGKLELKYIAKVFNLFGCIKQCFDLTETTIKVVWGNQFPPNVNIVNATCNFQGGGLKGCPVPYPAIQAFETYKGDLNLYDGIIVLFDGDKDTKNEVQDYFVQEFPKHEINTSLLVSNPCFESTLIDYCTCTTCRPQMSLFPDSNPPCDKYKKYFSSLTCFTAFNNTICTDKRVSAKGLIANLDMGNIANIKAKASDLDHLHNLIENFVITSCP